MLALVFNLGHWTYPGPLYIRVVLAHDVSGGRYVLCFGKFLKKDKKNKKKMLLLVISAVVSIPGNWVA